MIMENLVGKTVTVVYIKTKGDGFHCECRGKVTGLDGHLVFLTDVVTMGDNSTSQTDRVISTICTNFAYFQKYNC